MLCLSVFAKVCVNDCAIVVVNAFVNLVANILYTRGRGGQVPRGPTMDPRRKEGSRSRKAPPWVPRHLPSGRAGANRGLVGGMHATC